MIVATETSASCSVVGQEIDLSVFTEDAGRGPTLNGRNGGGDRYFTDGEVTIGMEPRCAAAHPSGTGDIQSPLRRRQKCCMVLSLRLPQRAEAGVRMEIAPRT
jgi:hypothetical protein